VPLTSRNGMGLYLSYVPKDGNKFELDPKDPVVIKADAMWESIKSETEQNKFYITETIKHISLNPQSLPRIEALKIIYFCNPFDWEVNNKGEYNFVYGFIMPFFLYSLFFVLKKERNAFILFVPILYSLFLALITHGSPRFRLPIEPYLIIISSYGLVYFFQGFRHKVYPVIIVLFFLLINLTFSINPEAVKPIIKAILKPLNIV
jgi:hypothetical protein